MTNKEIANTFQLLGKIMELHGENKFKIRSYQNAYITIRKLPESLSEMSAEEISAIKGVGKAIAGKIQELLEHGEMATLERYKTETPPGILEMMDIKGFGPKKIEVIWKELGVESIGELLYAVNENRLIELKGFGKKTQDDLGEKLAYFQKSKGFYHYAVLYEAYEVLLPQLKAMLPEESLISSTGKFRRKPNTHDRIEFLVAAEGDLATLLKDYFPSIQKMDDGQLFFTTPEEGLPVYLTQCDAKSFSTLLFHGSAAPEFISGLNDRVSKTQNQQFLNEEAIFESLELPYLDPELRESPWALEAFSLQNPPNLIKPKDIKGVVHSHSTWSDGINTLKEMAIHTQKQGYEYLVMSDHSKSAFYANGLSRERVLAQFQEIETLNKELAPFRIFKGIESDILNDGSLDYEEDILQQFDVIIASVHSNLRMDEAKATQRIIGAIENPYTHILGHPTGRLLLSRKAYPLDHKKILDACAANGVHVELNANPYRLDLDWTWIPYALEKGIQISINPDAHSIAGIKHIRYGVFAARKGGLSASNCLNAKNLAEFSKVIQK